MSPEVLVAILGTSGVAGIAGAVVTAWASKRKLGAEATEIITKAAAGVVTNLEAEVRRQEAAREAALLEHESKVQKMANEHTQAIQALVDSHAEEVEEMRRVLQLHVAWDAIAIAEMGKIGVKLPPAPPLLPARRFDHPTGDIE